MRKAAHKQPRKAPAPPSPAHGGGRAVSRAPPPYGIALADRPRKVHPHLQPRLAIGAVDDPLEGEADRVADRVLQMPARSGNEAARSRAAPAVQRKPAAGAPAAALPSLSGDLGPGRPLDAVARGFFEPRFGVDFGQVRIHTGERASGSAGALGALAYTAGNDIVFGAGQYHPETVNGRRLLAHELAHVVQQRGGLAGPVQVNATPDGARVQGQFWQSARRGWDMYTRMTDEGAPFAKKLMRWRMLGFGADYRTFPGDDWDQFMTNRPEIQRAMAARFEALVTGYAGGGPTGSEWMGGWKHFHDRVTTVRLNELESMRLTLHGCHRIEINGHYWVGVEGGVTTVKLASVRFTWVDRADLHPGVATVLETGERVNDREFTAAGRDYDIFIAFSMPSVSTWTVSGGKATHVRGWPPVTGAPAAGWRG